MLNILPLVTWAGGVVTECSEAALRGAVAGGGTVTFACDGTITLARTLTNNADLVLDATGHEITISGSNAVQVFYIQTNIILSLINLTVANGSGGQGAGVFNDGGSLNLSGVTFATNNSATLLGYGEFYYLPGAGGAIYNRAGNLHATNCSFIGNVANQPITFDLGLDGRGGAIYNEQGNVNLDRCTVLRNSATGGGASGYIGYSAGVKSSGGAVYNSGRLTVLQCTFQENASFGGKGSPSVDGIGAPGGASEGGAVFNSGVLKVSGSTFTGNASYAADGGDTTGPMPPSSGSGSDGGAAGDARGGAISSVGQLWVDSSTFASNTVAGGKGGGGGRGGQSEFGYGQPGGVGGQGGSGIGGALFVGGQAGLVNSTFAWNAVTGGAGGQGGTGGDSSRPGASDGPGGTGGNGGNALGAVADSQSWLRMTNCTIACSGGTAGAGGTGGSGGLTGSPGTNGVATGGLTTLGGQLLNSLLDANTPGGNCAGTVLDLGHNLSSDSTPAFTAIGSSNNTNPKLGPLSNNGGPTLTMALLAGSPAIDAAEAAAAPAQDQRGVPRPLGAAADIGAFEYAALNLLSPTLLIDRACQFEVQGPPGLRFAIEGSSTMRSWLRLGTNTLNSATLTFTDADATNYPSRCYRAVILP